MRLPVIILVAALSGSAVQAQSEVPAVNALAVPATDFLIDHPYLVGQLVHIPDGIAYMASEQNVLLAAPGGSVSLNPPWAERDDLAYLFEHCTDLVTGNECQVGVTGLVVEQIEGGLPRLSHVKFSISGPMEVEPPEQVGERGA